VAGEELNTSIGLGYIAQFYIDFGLIGIILLSFLLGLIAGIIYRVIIFVSPSYKIYISTVVVLFLGHFTDYESEIAKMLGGFIMNAIVFILILYFLGPMIHRYLMIKNLS